MHGSYFGFLDSDPGSYFVLLLSGFALATAIGALTVRRLGENPDALIDLSLAMLLAGVAGARVAHVLADGYFWDYVHVCTDPSLVSWKLTAQECLARGDLWNAATALCQPADKGTLLDTLDRCTRWAQFWAGGLTYYGGLIAASALGLWLLRRERFPLGVAVDAVGAGIGVGLAFGRMGCLLAGCCFGVPTDAAWGLVFPGHSAASTWQADAGLLASRAAPSLPVQPTQLLEAAGTLGIAALLLLGVGPRKRYGGQVFVAFIALYAALRFLLEFWRSDDRGGLVGLSTSQWVGLLLFAAMAALDARGRQLARARALA